MGLKIAVYLAFICIHGHSCALVTTNVFDEDKVGEVTSNSLADCNERDCNAMCRDEHHTAGWCVDGKCSCNNALGTGLDTEHSCNLLACEQFCRRLGFAGGACVGDKCDCDNFLSTTASNTQTVGGGCSLSACEQLCRGLGFPGGSCVGDKCDCDNFLPTKAFAASDSYTVEGGCYLLACEQLCRRLGFPGGACVGDKCQCDNFLPSTAEKLEDDCSANCLIVCQKLKGLYGVCDARRICSCKNEDSGFKWFEFKTSSIIMICLVAVLSILCQCCKNCSKRADSSDPK